MHQESERWLTQATEDLTTAQILFRTGRYGPCAFFCQQVAEKALKAVLYQSGERPWGHNVSSLLDQIGVVLGISLHQAPQNEALSLDEHYIRPRYPDAQDETEYDEQVAKGALQNAQTVFKKGNCGCWRRY
jgi:HEPN domain-containing protein